MTMVIPWTITNVGLIQPRSYSVIGAFLAQCFDRIAPPLAPHRHPTFALMSDAPSLSSAAADPARIPRARVTQLDIARVAGVHNTTVSLALRNSPAIPVATRQRIQAVAVELGYRPDPALQALASYRKALAVTHEAQPIAYVTNDATRWGWRKNPGDERYFLGAQRKAAERGYQLEHFWLGEPGMNPRRLSHVLFSRGISGVVLAAHRTLGGGTPELDWDRISTVVIGHVAETPRLHSVTNDRACALRLALQQARAAGYRRPALLLPANLDAESGSAWSLGFITEQIRLAIEPRIPVFHHDDANGGLHEPVSASTLNRMARWLAEHRPDVILGFRPSTLDHFAALELRIPRDLAFVDLLHETDDPAYAGVQQNCDRAGAVAVELLVSQLQQNLRGIPSVATSTFVVGEWRDGASLPRCGEAKCAFPANATSAAGLQGAAA